MLREGKLIKGPNWAQMGPYGPIWAHMVPIWAHMGPYGFHMGPYINSYMFAVRTAPQFDVEPQHSQVHYGRSKPGACEGVLGVDNQKERSGAP